MLRSRSSCSMVYVMFILLALLVPPVKSSWVGLSFDDLSFMCDQYAEFCENVLDDMGCSTDSANRVVIGCDPTTNNVKNWKGTCTCNAPMYINSAGVRVTQQLIANRISQEMSWVLVPFDTGPPYDIKLSYINTCKLLLPRLGCAADDMVVEANDTPIMVNGVKTQDFKCQCGTGASAFTESSLHLLRLLMDKMNDFNMRDLPIFNDPVYLSVPLSMCIVLICGKLGAIIATYIKLPPIVGFLLAGLAIQNILSPMFLKGAGYPYPAPAAELKLIALIVVLMRSGLSIKFEEITSNSLATFLFSSLPYLGEFFLWMYVGQIFFGWPIIDMGLFASVMAPLGPSVVISGLMMLTAPDKKKNSLKEAYPPKQALISTPIEAVIAIVLFGIFTNIEQTVSDPMYPWVSNLPLWENCVLIPANLLFSTVLGMFCGFIVSKYIDWRVTIKTDFIWVKVSNNPQMGSSTPDLVYVLLVLCYTMYSLCNKGYIQQCSGVLVVYVCCITVSKLCSNIQVVADIAAGLKGIWTFAEVFLFTLTGTSLSFDSTNGPLYGQRGLSSDMMRKVVGMMFIGTCGRLFMNFACAAIMWPTLPPHRKRLAWIGPFILNMFIFQLPKATVQATLGGVAYATHIIPGAVGLNEGLVISQACAFTVLIFAPIGAILTNYVGAPISLYLTRLDKEAKWNALKNRRMSISASFTGAAEEEGGELTGAAAAAAAAAASGYSSAATDGLGIDNEEGEVEDELTEDADRLEDPPSIMDLIGPRARR